MAHARNMFDITGSVGNLVYYKRNGKQYVRTKPVKKNKTISPAQALNHKKFKTVNEFAKSLSFLLTATMPSKKDMSASNFFVSHVMKHTTIDNSTVKIDYRQILVSQGRLKPALKGKVTSTAGNVIFKWAGYNCHDTNNWKDKAIMVVYCEDLNRCIYSINCIDRRNGIGYLPVPKFKGHEVHTWLAFISADGKLVSNSIYTGGLFAT